MITQKSRPPEIATASAALSPDRKTRFALYAICFGFFLVVLDTTALNVAMAAIQHDLGGTATGLQWVVNSYTMVFASLMLACGIIGDHLGARRFFISASFFTEINLPPILSLL